MDFVSHGEKIYGHYRSQFGYHHFWLDHENDNKWQGHIYKEVSESLCRAVHSHMMAIKNFAGLMKIDINGRMPRPGNSSYVALDHLHLKSVVVCGLL